MFKLVACMFYPWIFRGRHTYELGIVDIYDPVKPPPRSPENNHSMSDDWS